MYGVTYPWTTRPRLELLKIKSAFLRIAIVIFHRDFSSRLSWTESILDGESPSAQQLSVSSFPIVPSSCFNHCLSARFVRNTVATLAAQCSLLSYATRIIKNRIINEEKFINARRLLIADALKLNYIWRIYDCAHICGFTCHTSCFFRH